MIVVSPQGGMDIEAVAEQEPSAIWTEAVNIDLGLTDTQAKSLATRLGFSSQTQTSAAEMMKNLYKLFIDKDASMIEINPMVESAFGEGTPLSLPFQTTSSALHGR